MPWIIYQELFIDQSWKAKTLSITLVLNGEDAVWNPNTSFITHVQAEER